MQRRDGTVVHCRIFDFEHGDEGKWKKVKGKRARKRKRKSNADGYMTEFAFRWR
jgi:hypothetical protein